MKKIYHYVAILLMGINMEKKYFVINSEILAKNSSEIIRLFVDSNKFNEDDADNCIGVARLTDSQYKILINSEMITKNRS